MPVPRVVVSAAAAPAPQPSPRFHRSSFCAEGMCVEVASDVDGAILVRDTKCQPDGPVLRFSTQEWVDFLSGVAAGEFTPAALSAPR